MEASLHVVAAPKTSERKKGEQTALLLQGVPLGGAQQIRAPPSDTAPLAEGRHAVGEAVSLPGNHRSQTDPSEAVASFMPDEVP
ncbi:hypothetical protein NDU88_003971 [Pleurodeles waltl]|uniref:Uncharacterized protein n=1 Tax=Pleurodeles waltl TaxID=8319 RepID=A0AAV7KWD9_PLEWA|nr:hypothetical protein NDU88_003971 [Pleurodeles waltl]